MKIFQQQKKSTRATKLTQPNKPGWWFMKKRMRDLQLANNNTNELSIILLLSLLQLAFNLLRDVWLRCAQSRDEDGDDDDYGEEEKEEQNGSSV